VSSAAHQKASGRADSTGVAERYRASIYRYIFGLSVMQTEPRT
jgi:hypothetical protein